MPGKIFLNTLKRLFNNGSQKCFPHSCFSFPPASVSYDARRFPHYILQPSFTRLPVTLKGHAGYQMKAPDLYIMLLKDLSESYSGSRLIGTSF